MARKSFVREMRAWRKRSRERDQRNLERVVVSADEHIVSPVRVPVPRLQAVSVSLEEHGLVVTGQRTRRADSEAADLRQPFRRSFTPRTES